MKTREYWQHKFAGVVFKFVVISVIIWSMAKEPSIAAALGAFLLIQLASLALGLLHGATEWSLFRLYVRKKKVLSTLDFLTGYKFPAPKRHLISADEYLDDVRSDESLDIETRLAAAHAQGYKRGHQEAAPYTEGVFLNIIMSEGIERYRAIVSADKIPAPQKPSSPKE